MELPQIVPVLQVMEYPEFQRSPQMVVSENGDIYNIYIYTNGYVAISTGKMDEHVDEPSSG